MESGDQSEVGSQPSPNLTKAQKRQVKRRSQNKRKRTLDLTPSLHELQQSLAPRSQLQHDDNDSVGAVASHEGEDTTIQAIKAEGDQMAARSSRPRSGPANPDRDDAHEERTMWEQITRDLRRIKAINDRAREVGKLITEKEDDMARRPPSVKELDDLQELYRESTKIADEEWKTLNEEPADILKNIDILRALRAASETEAQRNVLPSKVRKPKAPKVDTDGPADSPGPSPSVLISASRLKGSSARSGSVASTRDGKDGKEALVKIEEGSEAPNGPLAERAGKLVVGTEVAYRQSKMKEDGSQWIQCNIINIVDVPNKKQRIYEVQDPEPDETGAPGQIYKTTAGALIAIPRPETILPDYPVGKHVLARYPETTTFYRAEVTGVKKDVCRLKFEDDQNKEMEVDRRFVLELGNK